MAKYSDEQKAAVLAALLTGQSVSSIAREYNMPKGTVSAWKNRGVTKKATQKRADDIGELLISYLKSNLATLEKQSGFFGDQDWLRKQNASEAAVLHGVMTDKAVRLLEALSKNNAADDTAS